MNDILKAAIEYHHRGWCVIPIKLGTKKAAVKWMRYQSERASEATIRKWFAADVGIAIVGGAVSGGLVIRDFDVAGAYEKWAARHFALAATLPTVRTARGCHVYCRMDGDQRTVKLPDGELRAEGSYTLAPPSVHPTGEIYQWVTPPDGPLPLVNLSDWELSQEESPIPAQQDLAPDLVPLQDTEGFGLGPTGGTEDSGRQLSQLSQLRTAKPVEPFSGEREQKPNDEMLAIACTMPQRTGQRERKLFELARRIHAIHGPDLTPAELLPVFNRWWHFAEGVVATKDAALSLACFVRAYERVHTAYGATMAEVLSSAKQATPPDWSRQIHCELLACICRELQRRNTQSPFFLSSRYAGEMTGESASNAWRKMGLMVAFGYLEITERGRQGGKRATRYRYTAPD